MPLRTSLEPEISSGVDASRISQIPKPGKLFKSSLKHGGYPMALFITAEQAADFAFRANIAAQQAKSVGCMVELNLDHLVIVPTAEQFHAEIELLEHEVRPTFFAPPKASNG